MIINVYINEHNLNYFQKKSHINFFKNKLPFIIVNIYMYCIHQHKSTFFLLKNNYLLLYKILEKVDYDISHLQVIFTNNFTYLLTFTQVHHNSQLFTITIICVHVSNPKFKFVLHICACVSCHSFHIFL